MKSPTIDIHTHKMCENATTISSRGIHPWCAGRENFGISFSDFEGFDAIGEIGLDYCCSTPIDIQQSLFEKQLKIAELMGKIVVIHCVKAYNETLNTLKHYSLRCVIFHGFVGPIQMMERIIKLGYYISYGERTFSSPKTIEALRATPIDRLFLESDDCDTPIEDIYDRVAVIIGIDTSTLRDKIFDNYNKITK